MSLLLDSYLLSMSHVILWGTSYEVLSRNSIIQIHHIL